MCLSSGHHDGVRQQNTATLPSAMVRELIYPGDLLAFEIEFAIGRKPPP